MLYTLLLISIGVITGLKGILILQEEPGEEFARPGVWLNVMFIITFLSAAIFASEFFFVATTIAWMLASTGILSEPTNKKAKYWEGFGLLFFWLVLTMCGEQIFVEFGTITTATKLLLGLSIALALPTYVFGTWLDGKPKNSDERPYHSLLEFTDIPLLSVLIMFMLKQESILQQNPQYVAFALGLFVIFVALRQEKEGSILNSISATRLSEFSELKLLASTMFLVGTFISSPIVYIVGGAAIALNSLAARNYALALAVALLTFLAVT